ncbi:MAG: alpha/beta hydrolase [Candidatus Bathyarchaeota archaeon]|nr:alpha/beta hydrolase [Candidatus Bathyarchaeota archaeon]
MSEPKEGFLKSGGYRVHYLLWGGTGPKLVFIHSMGMDAHGFEAIYNALNGEYQMLGLTILDHGDSDIPKPSLTLPDHAEIMRDCYRQLAFEPIILIGHSVGGMMGITLAAEHPNELKGLVLVDIAPRIEKRKYSSAPPPKLFESKEQARDYFKEKYSSFTEDAVENRIKHGLKEDNEGKLTLKSTPNIMRPSLSLDLWPFAKRIETATLMVLGGKSAVVTLAAQERMREVISGIEIVTVKEATHMVPQDNPIEFERHLRRFLERIA